MLDRPSGFDRFCFPTDGAEKLQQPACSFVLAGTEVLSRDLSSLGFLPEKANVNLMIGPVSAEELEYFGELQKDRPRLRIVLTDQQRDLYCYPIKFDEKKKGKSTFAIGFNSEKGLIISTGPSFKKLNDDEFSRSGKEPVYLRKQDDWLLVAKHRENLDFPTEQIEELIESFGPKHRVRATIHFENFSEDLWKDAVSKANQLLKPMLTETPQARRLNDDAIDVLQTVQILRADLLRDPDRRNLTTNLQVQFAEESPGAELIGTFAAQRSKYEGVIDDEADFNVLLALKLAPEVSAFCIKTWIDASKEAAESVKGTHSLFDSLVKTIRTIGVTTFYTEKVDLALSGSKSDDAWEISLAGDLRNSELLQIYGEEVQESNSAGTFKEIVQPATGIEPEKRVWRVYQNYLVSCPENRIVIASSPERLAKLQELIDKPQVSEESLPPVLIQGRVSVLHDLLAEHSPEFPAREKLLETLQGDERFKISALARERTLKLEFSLGEQVLLRLLLPDSVKIKSPWWTKFSPSAK